MDYEKKYNEALAWMRELYQGLHGATKEDAEHFFPELRESEDEKIRGNVVNLVKQFSDILHPETQRRMLAWLEKQKEQKPIKVVYYNHPKRKEIGFYCNKKEVCWEDMPLDVRMHDYPYHFRDGMDYYPFKPDQTPAEWNDADMREARENLITCCRDWERGEQTTLLPIVAVRARYFLEHLTEPKPVEWSDYKDKIDIPYCSSEQEWSEEDEKIRHCIGLILTDAPEKRFKDYNLNLKECLVWLGNKTANAEWSEEDEKLLDFWLDVIDRNDWRMDENFCKASREFINRLKSLRPQHKQEVTDEEIEEMVTKRSRSTGTTKSEMGFYRNGIKDAIKRFGLRPSWKPSKDEERLINTSISFLKDFADKGYENAVECIDWLKSKLNGNSNK